MPMMGKQKEKSAREKALEFAKNNIPKPGSRQRRSEYGEEQIIHDSRSGYSHNQFQSERMQGYQHFEEPIEMGNLDSTGTDVQTMQ